MAAHARRPAPNREILRCLTILLPKTLLAMEITFHSAAIEIEPIRGKPATLGQPVLCKVTPKFTNLAI
jgi:hypothetical protein